ncbi:MAG TPA: amidohydrolase family protein, partial [Armatimonadota bacterium]|nr:amidohydrolase family protein [Armatimonadota bacterium]
MNLSTTEAGVFEAIAEIDVIDAHEHLVPESVRVAMKVDFFILFANYCRADLISAGMAPDTYARLLDDEEMGPDEKWEQFAPFYPMIKHGSYARPARIWLNEVLGHEDLTAANCVEVSEQLQSENTPGVYERILRDQCHIRSALVDNSEHHEQFDMDLLKPLWRFSQYTMPATVQHAGAATLDAYLDQVDAEGERMIGVGAFGLKMMVFEYNPRSRERAAEAFALMADPSRAGELTREHVMAFQSAVCDRAFEVAKRHDLTVAVHSGVWGDFRESHPCHLIPMAAANPGVNFDLFHLGMPFVREATFVGKMYPNVSLNLCWNSVVSPEVTVRM